MRNARAALALILAAAFSPACRKSASVTAPSTVTVAVRADVTGIFPNAPIQNESFTLDVNSNVFEGLVRLDRNLSPEPAIAERWENPDEQTYVFQLRKGLRFSDGRPLTATDVAASLMAALEKPFVTRDTLSAIQAARPLSPDRLEIRTRAPYPVLLQHLPRGFVVPKEALGKTPVPPIGSGPYRLESWTPGQEIVLVKNEYFRDATPAFERVRLLVRPDDRARVDAVLAGEAQMADNVPLEEVARLGSIPDVQVIARAGLRVLFLAFRMNAPPFADPRVREAFDLAIDREELVARALGGRAIPATQLVPPAVSGFNPSIKLTKPDRTRAKKLLADAGYAKGLTVRLDGTNNRYVKDGEILKEVARQLGEVGVKVEVNALPKSEFFPLIMARKSSFYLLGWACETGDAGEALDALIHSPASRLYGENNFGDISDRELDRLIDEGNRSPFSATRKDLLAQSLARVTATRVVLPLEIQTEAVVLSRTIAWEPPVNFSPRLYEIHPAAPSARNRWISPLRGLVETPAEAAVSFAR